MADYIVATFRNRGTRMTTFTSKKGQKLWKDLGIKRYKTMADKLMNIPNDGTQNYPFCRLPLVVETQLNDKQ